MQITIVDENDVEIGSKERNELDKGDIYRVSALWINDSKQRILLAQRTMTKKKDPGKWGPAVAGTIEVGETYESNIIKEIQEELGVVLPLSDLQKGPKIRRENPTGTFFCQWYFATVNKEITEFVFQESEVMALKWITLDELKEAVASRPSDFVASAPSWFSTILT